MSARPGFTTFYPPLSTSLITLSSYDKIIAPHSLLLIGLSSDLTSLNFIISFINMKPICISLINLLIYLWRLNTTSFMLLIILPMLTGLLIMLITNIHYVPTYDWLNLESIPFLGHEPRALRHEP